MAEISLEVYGFKLQKIRFNSTVFQFSGSLQNLLFKKKPDKGKGLTITKHKRITFNPFLQTILCIPTHFFNFFRAGSTFEVILKKNRKKRFNSF